MNQALLHNPINSGTCTQADGQPSARMQTLAQFYQGPDWKRHTMRGYGDHLLIWVTRGQGRMLLGGQRSGLGAHNAIFVPTGTMVKLELGAQTFGLVVRIPPTNTINWSHDPLQLRIRDGYAQSEMTSHLEALQKELDSNRPGADDAANCFLGLISVWLMRQHMGAPPQTGRRPPAANRLVRAFTTLVEQEYCSGKSMADFAETLGVTPTHLTRTCKDMCERTASEILIDRVHLAARERLCDTDAPVKSVAQELGFTSAAYFTRAFQHQTGETPSQFRQRHRK